MAGAKSADDLVAKFRKIMGPVASTLAKDTAVEIGARQEGDSIVTKDNAQLERFRKEYAKRCGRIIGSKLAESVAKE
jgi:hypothetical protein